METKDLYSSINKEQGWNRNTDLAVDLKTVLRSDRSMKLGKEYQGVLRLDQEGITDEYLSRDAHYTFVETLPWTTKRNPRVFRGKYITITRRSDGSLRPNFRPMTVGRGFSVECYAFEVYRELYKGLNGFVEEAKSEK